MLELFVVSGGSIVENAVLYVFFVTFTFQLNSRELLTLSHSTQGPSGHKPCSQVGVFRSLPWCMSSFRARPVLTNNNFESDVVFFNHIELDSIWCKSCVLGPYRDLRIVF